MANVKMKALWAMSKRITILLFFLSNFMGVYSQDISDISKEFKQDTARVEQEIRDLRKEAQTTHDMALLYATLETRYDELLNKYYKILYSRLDDKGKKALREAQLNWIKFRDAEQKLLSELYRYTYEETHGATIWIIVFTRYGAEITRDRVFVLHKYLVLDDV